MAAPKVIGFIGDGQLLPLQEVKALKNVQISTPFGLVNVQFGKLDNVQLVVYNREDSSSVQAMASALQLLNCEFVIGLYSVGGLKTEYPPGRLVHWRNIHLFIHGYCDWCPVS